MIDNHHHDCWICDRECYTIFFWSPEIGAARKAQIEEDDQMFIISEIKRINNAPQNDRIIDADQNAYIYGSFTNWKPKRMYEIGEFCKRIDQSHTEPRSNEGYRSIWKDIIWTNLKYKKPQLIDADLARASDEMPLYVYATYMKSGKQFYGIETRDVDGVSSMHIHSCISKFRTEDIPLAKKIFKYIDRGARRFRKETSVFRRWIPDDESIRPSCIK